MRDHDVRAALHRRLSADHADDHDTVILDEVGLCQTVRVDVAVLNGHLAGYELKSARDTLQRLPTQVEVYSKVLDFATLVVADRHHIHALEFVPPWWGVIVASEVGGEVELATDRVGEENPAPDGFALAQLLWREEALAILAARGQDRGVRRKARWYVWDRLATALPVEELQQIVRQTLKERQGWRDAVR